ncbi:UNVERIFIED_ORG: hypothetical protein DFO51_104387 [Aeromonas veronii]
MLLTERQHWQDKIGKQKGNGDTAPQGGDVYQTGVLSRALRSSRGSW